MTDNSPLPCPFCGSNDVRMGSGSFNSKHNWCGGCGCGARGPSHIANGEGTEKDEKNTVNRWNNRDQPNSHTHHKERIEELENLCTKTATVLDEYMARVHAGDDGLSDLFIDDKGGELTDLANSHLGRIRAALSKGGE